jgi:SagB-type dehydrogenase family enzyme
MGVARQAKGRIFSDIRRSKVYPLAWLTLAALGVGTVLADGDTLMKLPAPHTSGGKPLMQALSERHSTREFSMRTLPVQLLSDLLWAASGVNRPDSGKRTAPSARDWREIDIYVVMEAGAYVYDPAAHVLRRVVARDVRALTGMQDFVGNAPLNLVYVADRNRMSGARSEDLERYAAADSAFMAQNVYLFCASAGLGAVVRGMVNRAALSSALGLGRHQEIMFAQTVGYPK